ncbi:MAG: RHS repeat-associated core domain-containing protein [Bacteroidetes bacterium]|nr:RHS repeat-associated core domain-containing protein [Bacteroidota bacterium]
MSGAAGCGGAGRRVSIYPTEYLTNGIGWNGVREQITQVVTKPLGVKEYQISDHLASLRVAVEGTAERHVDYDPWGNVLGGSGGVVAGERQGFNNQEADRETGLYDLSDRRYDPETGHFPSPDRLWETDRATSPYAYCADNPVRLTDPTGMQAAPTIPTDGKEGFVEGVGKDLYNDFSSGIFDTYICPAAPTLRLLLHPVKTVGGYVEMFKNATGQNGGGAAARFWTTKAIETVVFGGAARVAAARPVAPTTAAEATPAAEPAAPAEAAAQKASTEQGSSTSAGTTSPKGVRLPANESQVGHIFREVEGHLKDSPANRQMLIDVANDAKCKLGTDQFGKVWLAKTLPNGTQVWVTTRNGLIVDGGLNQTPRTFNPQTGLSAAERPGRK